MEQNFCCRLGEKYARSIIYPVLWQVADDFDHWGRPELMTFAYEWVSFLWAASSLKIWCFGIFSLSKEQLLNSFLSTVSATTLLPVTIEVRSQGCVVVETGRPKLLWALKRDKEPVPSLPSLLPSNMASTKPGQAKQHPQKNTMEERTAKKKRVEWRNIIVHVHSFQFPAHFLPCHIW